MADSVGTRQRIVRAMVGLLSDTSLDKLQVSAICERAGISRQTFYRCFDDKYAAALWYADGLIAQTCRRIGHDLGWYDGYLRFFRLVERSCVVMQRLDESDDYNSIFHATIRSSAADFRDAYVARHGHEPDELLEFQMQAFARTATASITAWIDGGCSPCADTFVDRFLTLVPRELYAALDMPPVGDPATDEPLFVGA